MTSPIEQIKDRLDIVDVISSYIKLDKAGRNLKARCPFHNEKTPSFTVSPDRQTFYCFGCQAKGDMFEFVQKFESVEFKEALKLLAHRAGVELAAYDRGNHEEERGRKERIFECLDAASVMYEKFLAEAPAQKEYLKKRGLSDDTIRKWRLGWAPNEWRTILNGLNERGFKEEELLSAGLVKKTEDGSKIYDVFRGRIMFPLFDAGGKIIAFSGRLFVDDKKSPKYVNSPETLVFKKSEALYGIQFARNEIRRLDYSVLVEGQMDLVLSHQAGTVNTVASSGTALTESHLRRLQKMSNRVIFAYDGDIAGRAAARKGGELALSLGMEVKVASLPEEEDPGSLIVKSEDSWRTLLKNSVNLIEFATNEAVRLSMINGAKKVSALSREFNKSVIPLLASVSSEMARSEFVALAARKTNIPEKSIWADLEKFSSNDSRSPGFSDGGMESQSVPLSSEELILGLILSRFTENSSKWGEIEEKFKNLVGEEVYSELRDNSRFPADALVFQVEAKCEGLDPLVVAGEALQRLEKKVLTQKFREIAERLDKQGGSKDAELKAEAAQISKRLSEI